ncbi:MAG: YggT family protein [Candidatus Caenarcaniphilales bacterium]|jgi:YggT family protein|nr:YggT family protein [Candidatus Caenarcaniphilales bacterium]
MLSKLALLLIQIIELYGYVILAWVIGSWFPQMTSSKFYRFLDQLVYPYARIFRGLIPPIGGFDFSIVLALLVLGLIKNLLSLLYQ